MIENSVVDVTAAVEAEFDLLKRSGRVSSVRIERAENILVTHLSCPKAGIIRPRVRGGALVSYLVKGSGGAVYRVDPQSWQCSCPDAHRRGKGCKHAILCWALWRAYRPASAPELQKRRRRCAAEPKITRHERAGLVDVPSSSYAERECVRCLSGLVYDEQAGWVSCETCSSTGCAVVFVYPKKRRLQECAGCGERFEGRELVEVQESLTYFEGDLLCHECAAGSDADVL